MLDQTKHLPAGVGVGYKSKHFSNILKEDHPVEWLEIHAENYMGAGGRPLAQLRTLSDRFPISVHGVGLSIGGEGRLDAEHLARLKHLTDTLDPASFSEHLAWSTHDAGYFNDLLPLPYTEDTLTLVCDHIDELRQVVQRTGCGLLLDVNNVFVSANNLRLDPQDYIDSFPHEAVGEIHLGGHDEDHDEDGAPLLIDSHGREVADPVWHLYTYTLATGGPKPTLIEWDTDVPEWDILAAEAGRAALRLEQVLA